MKPGEFYRFTPDNHHCTEGIAAVEENGTLNDTFWGSAYDNPLSETERATLELYFDSADFDEIKHSLAQQKFEKFHPDDRRRVTSQHGLQGRYFVRKGAKEDIATQIKNTEAWIEQATAELRSAERNKQRAEEWLAQLRKMQPEPVESACEEEQELSAECPQCGGSGQNPDGPHGHCKACKGKGEIAAP